MGIPFGTEFNATSINRGLLSSTPQQLLHLRIKIDHCNYPANIEFTDISFTPMFSLYCINANDPTTNPMDYSSTSYGDNILDEICKPIITYFTPTVATGIGDSIVIKGKYFGDNRLHNNGVDTAQVQFRDANEVIIEYFQRLDTLDYLYWSDKEIRVSATSYIDSEGNSGIGTGKFIVKNKWGDTTKTNSELFVEYAIENKLQIYPDKQIKKRVNLVYDTIGYVFAFNSAILNDPIKKAVTEKAIRDWSCQTGVNFKVLYDDASQTANSYISFSNNVTNPPVKIAYADPIINVSCLQNPETRHEIFITGAEIEMNSDTPWDYDTTGNISTNKYSYYSVLIHELGHIHQLDHILNENTELMRPYIDMGQYRTFSSNLFAGANDVIQYNENHFYNGCNYSPMVFGTPHCTTNSIAENTSKNNSFVLFPNPFKNKITIKHNKNNINTKVIVYNIIGEIVYTSSYNSKYKTLNLSNLKSGSYILKIKSNNEIYTKQIIKY